MGDGQGQVILAEKSRKEGRKGLARGLVSVDSLLFCQSLERGPRPVSAFPLRSLMETGLG